MVVPRVDTANLTESHRNPRETKFDNVVVHVQLVDLH